MPTKFGSAALLSGRNRGHVVGDAHAPPVDYLDLQQLLDCVCSHLSAQRTKAVAADSPGSVQQWRRCSPVDQMASQVIPALLTRGLQCGFASRCCGV